jgi:3-hydroxyacyl-CoA dehydrogenase/enoyl-CoA hydratase/3-hydroxybutyryl-CoA epimerase
MRLGIMSYIGGDRLELGHGLDVGGATSRRYWHRLREPDGIEWLVLDQIGASTNRVDDAMLEELDGLLSEIERDRPKGVVIRSAKSSGFIAGADIAQFRGVTDAAPVVSRLTRAHKIIDRLAALPVPTVAVIHGFCLGGGLELALACRNRIAITGAMLGFPEVQLGLHPGLGGTARLTRLIDPLDAMTMMLTGKNKWASAARKAGLVDTVTEERHVAAAVRAAISGSIKTRERGLGAALVGWAPVRRIAARKMRATAQKRARPEQYPAPFALIDLWENKGGNFAAMKSAEVSSFAHLLIGQTAQNLIRLFFLREKMKKAVEDHHTIRHVHVVGAGAMGGDIAAWCALKGLRVTLADMSLKALASAIKRASALFDHQCHSAIERRDAEDRLIPDPKGMGSIQADLVIEAIPENLDLKKKVHAALEASMKPDAILATNTSSIRLEDLREGLTRPERLIGIHFFNPVAKMQLVEIVNHDKSAPDALATARAFTVNIDRLPVAVKSAPGFLVNRTLMPYLLEALLALDEGVPAETIDQAAESFGMPMGPLELADEVGLDICVDVAKMLRQNIAQPFPPLPEWFENKVANGDLGKKSGRGIYEYEHGKAQKRSVKSTPDPGLVDRLLLPLVNACATCLRDEIVADEDAVDGALVFGAGFAPFRSGPMHYARQRGIGEVIAALEGLAGKHGDRFNPDPFWHSLGGQ